MNPKRAPFTRREILAAGTALAVGGLVAAAADAAVPSTAPAAAPASPGTDAVIGPLVGRADPTSAML
jgi:hypothetical protein